MIENGKTICNCCGRELERCGERYEDHLHIIKNWGYLSKQDGIAEEIDICPGCLEKWERTFVIAPRKYRVTELL